MVTSFSRRGIAGLRSLNYLRADGVPDSTAFGGTLYMDVIHPVTQAHSLLGAFAAGASEQVFRLASHK